MANEGNGQGTGTVAPAQTGQVYPQGMSPDIAKQMGLISTPKSVVGQTVIPKTTAATKPFNLSAELDNMLAPAYDHILKGVDDLQDSIAGSKMLMGNGEGYENVEAQLSVNRHRKALPADTPEWAAHVSDTIGPVLETLPFLGQLTKDAFIGAGAGASAGGIVGASSGAVFPPAEAITVPAGMITGAAFGAEANAATSMGLLSAGGLYMQLRREGATHDTAKNVAIGAGVVIGALQLGQNWLLAGIAKKAALKAASNPETQQALFIYAKQLFKTTMVTVDTAELQQATTIGAQAIAAHMDNNPALGPKDIMKQFEKTAVNTLLLIGAAHLGGKAVGHAGMFAKSLTLKKADVQAHLEVKAELAAKAIPEESTQTPAQVKEDAMKAALAELYPQEEPELKEQTAKEDTRTKGEVERDDKAAQLRRDINIVRDKKAKALKQLRGAISATRLLPTDERIQHEMEVNKLRDDARELAETQKEIEKQEVELENEHRATELKRLERTIDKTEPPTKAGLSDSQLARNSMIQKVLDKVRFYFHNQDKAADVVSEYETLEFTGGKPDLELQEEYAAASLVHNIKGKNSKGLRQLKIEIQEAYTEGRKGRLEELAKEAQDRKDFLDRFENGLQGDKPVSSHANEPEKPRFHIPFFGKSLTNWFGNYTQHNQTILSEAPTLAERNKLVGEIEVRAIKDKVEDAHAANMEKLYADLADKTRTSVYKIKELIRKGAKKKIAISFWEPSEPGSKIFKESKTTVTINRAIEILGQLENEKAAKALVEGNGYVEPNDVWDLEAIENTKSEIEGKLEDENPLYLDFVEGYQKAYKRLYAKISKAIQEDTGYPLPEEPNYFGPMLHAKNDKRTVEGATTEEFEQHLKSQSGGNAIRTKSLGATKERTGDTSPLIIDDVNDTFNTYSRLAENWIGFRKLVRQRIAPLHGSVKINTIIKRKFGNDLHRSWKQKTKEVLYGEVNDKNAIERFLDAVIFKNIPFALLAAKPAMLPMHIAATGNMFFYLPPGAVIKGLAKFWANPIKNAKEMMSSVQYQRRHSGHDIETATNTQYSDKMQHPAMTVYEHIGMGATVYGIKAEIIPMYVAYEHYVNDLKMPHEAAMEKAGELVNRTQVSGAVDLRSPLNKSLVGRLFAAYNGQIIKMAQQVAIDADFYMSHRTKEAALTLFSSVAAAAYTAFVFEGGKAMYRYMTASKDSERKRAQLDMVTAPFTALANFVNLPVIKTAVQDALVLAANHLDKANGGKGDISLTETDSLLDLGGKTIYNIYMDIQAQEKDPAWYETHQLKLLENVNALVSFVVKSPFGSYLHFKERMERKEKTEHPPLEGIQ
jgi:hypothetical protein